MSDVGILLTIIGVIALIGAYFLHKNTPKSDKQ